MTDTSEVYWYSKIFRWLFAMIDKIVYGLVSFITDTFNLLAGSEIRTGETVGNIFARIQLILGIIILFKLVISFFSGIVDPDGFNDSKKGFGNVIKRIVVVLVMMLLIVPLHIPENDVVDLEKAEGNSQKTWNARMNDSGILFGTLAEIQSRIMNGNLIPRLILGTDHADEGEEDIPLLLLKNFIFINLNPGAKDSTEPDNWLCPIDRFENSSDEDDKAVTAMQILNNEKVIFEYQTEMHCENESAYSKEDIEKMGSQEGWELIGDKDSPKLYAQYVAGAFDESNQDKCAVKIEKLDEDDPKVDKKLLLERKRETLLESINYKCDLNHIGAIDRSGGERYIFVYKFFLSTVAGILCFVLLLSLTVDVAIRVFKLLLLRLISPVAILSYIDPKSEKTFNNWVKAVATTFLDLFIRIAIISFIMLFISFIKDFDFTSTYNGEASFAVQSFARLILFFGLFFFAKEAPKFITETLGIDSKNGGGLFGGFGKMLGVTTMARGIVGSAVSDAKVKYAERLGNPKTADHKIRNVASSIISGITGGAGGAITGTKSLVTADKDYSNAVMNAQKKRTQLRASHSTGFGRFADRQSQLFTGQSLADRDTAALEIYKDVFNKSKSLKEALETEAKKHGSYGSTIVNGELRTFNVERLAAALSTADEHGNFDYIDNELGIAEQGLNASWFDANTKNAILESQVRNYQAGITRRGATDISQNGIITNAQLELSHSVNKAGKKYKEAYNQNGIPGGLDNVKKLIGISSADTTKIDTEQKHINHMANKQANDNH